MKIQQLTTNGCDRILYSGHALGPGCRVLLAQAQGLPVLASLFTAISAAHMDLVSVPGCPSHAFRSSCPSHPKSPDQALRLKCVTSAYFRQQFPLIPHGRLQYSSLATPASLDTPIINLVSAIPKQETRDDPKQPKTRSPGTGGVAGVSPGLNLHDFRADQ